MSDFPALLFDLTGRAHLVIEGKDRAAFLHGLVTNDIKKLTPGQGCHAALLTPKGKMLIDLWVYSVGDHLIVDTEPELAVKLEALLGKYLIFTEAVITNRTAQTSVLHLVGPGARDALSDLGFTAALHTPHAAEAFVWNGLDVVITCEARTESLGYDVRLPLHAAAAFKAAIGLSPTPLEELERLRILAGVPRWGSELTEDILPNEALFERDAISYNKGCYIGQETTARIKTYGKVTKLLCHVMFPPGAPITPGTELREGDVKAGSVTSVGRADDGSLVCLAFLKRDLAGAGTTLLANGDGAAAGTVADLPALPLAS